MKKRKLNYRFHNPNTAEVAANYIANLLIEVNARKVEEVIQSAIAEIEKEECYPAKAG